MRSALKALETLATEGLITRYAIGGAVAAAFYAPAVSTEDLDVFAFMKPAASGLLILTPLYERLQTLGGRVEGEFVVFGSWPLQILPAYTPLVEAAVLQAVEQSFHGLQVPVVSAEHLCAIALQTGRSKDYQRVHTLLESGQVDTATLRKLIEQFHLQQRWETYVRRFT